MNSGIDKSVEYLFDFPTCKNAGSDLRKPFRLSIEPGRLRVEGNKLGIQRELAPAQNSTGAIHIVNIICFKAIDNLDLMLLSRFPHVREGLCYTVICHCNCRHTPVGCLLYHSGGIGQCIKGGKPRVQMKFHALDFSIVPANRFLPPNNALWIEHHIVVIFRKGHVSVNREMITGVYGLYDALVIGIAQKSADTDGVGMVGNIKRQNCTAAFCKCSGGDIDNIPFHGDFSGFQCQRVHRDRLQLQGASHQHLSCRSLRRIRADRSSRNRNRSL